MVFPILPLFSRGEELASVVEAKPYVGLTGQALLNLSYTSVEQASAFIQNNISFSFVCGLLSADHRVSDDDIVRFVNSGISVLFVASKEQAISLEELGVPKDRVAIFDGSAYTSKFGVVQRFCKDNIVEAKDLSEQKLTQALLSAAKTDREDKLYTTLVVDTHERCLGLVYSSKESIKLAIEKQVGVYFSRSRNEIWVKGLTSGNTQKLMSVQLDCDGDALKFVVVQEGKKSDFCHLNTASCYGEFQQGLVGLEQLLRQRLENAPEKSYTRRLFNDPELLSAKIKEEAEELTDANTKSEISWEAADLFYFAMVKLVSSGVSLDEVERNLHTKHLKITRRQGDAKPKFLKQDPKPESVNEPETPTNGSINLNVVSAQNKAAVAAALSRPIQKTADIMHLVNPIVEKVRKDGNKALLEFTSKFDGVQLESPVLEAPFPDEYLEGLTQEMKEALDLSMENVRKFHDAQLQKETLQVETQPGVMCSRFPRPIEKVGLYIPGGTAVLPSTALMLGVPARVAQCKEIVFASPPRKSDGRVSPEVVYVAKKVGASMIVLAGGAQAVAAMAYGTESVPKVDKILGPGNQFVTAAKMYVQNDTQALCSIDMPAGPSEVLVIADEDADADFVASDLLSQAEHGVDSQVILVGVSLSEKKLTEIQDAVHRQAVELPRVDIVRKCIAHSSVIVCDSYEEAFDMSNNYAPEHLILQIVNASKYVDLVFNAGSVFVGAYTPESCGDYSSGTNHTLPTYGYARQYSGVNTATFQKFITSQSVTPEGLQNIGRAVMSLAKVEGLDGHRNAIKIRMQKLDMLPGDFQ
ncbi:LANO_0G01288g1_1 [Lachancea nothofagi CBS 11611]|uniref:Histidine biosynthesis trifunctional protein n=1 Tax=Lachancea nothofagi CBS 11611 TaxID=1266666 RepID=A0A1G4KEJ5_9SACH|nr:LANO_0G01288g1_1 [Lachancea nothofagi CBS 11611]